MNRYFRVSKQMNEYSVHIVDLTLFILSTLSSTKSIVKYALGNYSFKIIN